MATLGESPDFPAFFSRSSGYKVKKTESGDRLDCCIFLHFQAPFCVESETAAARLIGTPHVFQDTPLVGVLNWKCPEKRCVLISQT